MMRAFANQRIAGFESSVFTAMSQLAKEAGAVNLGQGFPDFPGPEFVKTAAKVAIDAENNQYAPSAGIVELRQAIAATWEASTGQIIDPMTEVTVTSGATEAIFAAIQASIGPGDELLVFEPFYDSYPASVTMAGGALVPVRLAPPDWSFDPDRFVSSISSRTRGVLLNTPHNPTGKVFHLQELQFIAEHCIAHDLFAITDEVYDRILYDDAEHVSLATLPGMRERTLTINSTGKTFSMTGWKIGYAIGPPAMNAALRSVHQFVTFATATPFQYAMAHAMTAANRLGYYATMQDEYHHRRHLLQEGLSQAGLTTLPIAGSYFLTAEIDGLGFDTDVQFCRWLTTEVGVAAVPPSAFYAMPSTAPLLARFCFAKEDETLFEASRRLAHLPELLARRSA